MWHELFFSPRLTVVFFLDQISAQMIQLCNKNQQKKYKHLTHLLTSICVIYIRIIKASPVFPQVCCCEMSTGPREAVILTAVNPDIISATLGPSVAHPRCLNWSINMISSKKKSRPHCQCGCSMNKTSCIWSHWSTNTKVYFLNSLVFCFYDTSLSVTKYKFTLSLTFPSFGGLHTAKPTTSPPSSCYHVLMYG